MRNFLLSFCSIIFSFNLLGSVSNPAMNNYDVKFYKIDLNATNTNTIISGSVTMGGVALQKNLSPIVFDLSSSNFSIDSVFVNGIKATSHTLINDQLSITNPTTIDSNQLFIVKTYYHGTGTVGSNFPAGMSNGKGGSNNNYYTYTVSEPYYSYLWWPCKQDLTDKADSSFVFITTTSSNKVAANGLLTNTVSLSGNRNRWIFR